MTAIETIAVREMADGEQATVRALLTEAFLPYELHLPPGMFEPYLKDFLDLSGIPLVAESQGELVGMTLLYLPGSRHSVPLPPGWAMARAASVVPRMRRTGVGQALLAECERRARATATHMAFHSVDQMPDTFAFALRVGYPRRPDLDFDAGPALGLPASRIMIKAFGRRLPPA
jgi:GNAT superfamily N-acetyltransferase